MTWFFIILCLYWLAFFAYCYLHYSNSKQIKTNLAESILVVPALGRTDLLLLVYLPFIALWLYAVYPSATSQHGFGFGYISIGFIASFIFFTLFSKRIWLLFNNYTLDGKILQTYFQSRQTHLLFLLLSVLFTIFFLVAQTKASAGFINILSAGKISFILGIFISLFFPALYVAINGLRGVLIIYRLQLLFVILGFIVLVVAILVHFGSWANLYEQIFSANLGKSAKEAFANRIVLPTLNLEGVYSLADLNKLSPASESNNWSYLNLVTFSLLFLALPSLMMFFTNIAINESTAKTKATKDKSSFLITVVMASLISILVICLAPIIFLASQSLDPYSLPSSTATDFSSNLVKDYGLSKGDKYLPYLVNLIGGDLSWLSILLSLFIFSALQVAGICYLANSANLVTKDLILPLLSSKASKFPKRCFLIILTTMVVLILILSVAISESVLILYGLAFALASQMLPALLGLTYWPYLTRGGINLGIIGGIIAVMLSEQIFLDILKLNLWSAWPFGLHSIFYGLATNFLLAIIFSFFTQDADDARYKDRMHNFLRGYTGLPRDKRYLKIPTAVMLILWMILVFSPVAWFGNFIFGVPENFTSWLIPGIPSIWLWQIIFWLVGMGLLWFIATKMELLLWSDNREDISSP